MLRASTRHIILDELATDSQALEIADDVRSVLERTGLVSAHWSSPGLWKLLPNGYVGAAQVDDLLVEVRPKDKVGIGQILFMLSYAKDPGFRPENVVALPTTDLWAALGETLARQGERATERGILQGYVPRDEALRTIRGRIRISDQVTRRPGLFVPVEVTHDEFTVDIPENRIFRSALRRMLAVPRLGSSVRRRLIHLDRKLSDASLLNTGSPLPAWSPSRSNTAYVPTLRIAEIILQNIAAEAGTGKMHVASFVVDMAKVFEDFVTVALTEALEKYPGRTKAQYKTYLDEKPNAPGVRRVAMKPDVVHELEGKPALIFDAKYKAASSSGSYPNSDYYQMLAYATAIGKTDAWLIYADSGNPVWRRVCNSRVSIHEFPIDLSKNPTEVLTRVELLTKRAFATVRAETPPN